MESALMLLLKRCFQAWAALTRSANTSLPVQQHHHRESAALEQGVDARVMGKTPAAQLEREQLRDALTVWSNWSYNQRRCRTISERIVQRCSRYGVYILM